MSDDTTPTPGAEQGGEGGNYTPPATQAELDRIIADRLSRERQKFADYDELKSAAEKLAEIEEAYKAEAQRLAEERDSLAAKVTEYETREQINAWKADVSKETGVPANVLAGSTLEEIKAHAEQLRPLIAAQAPAKPAPLIVPAEGKTPPALNSSALEDALRKAVGAN